MSSVIYRLDDLACFQPIYTSHELEPSTFEQCVSVCLRTRMDVSDIVQWAPSWILRPGRLAPLTTSPGSCRRLWRRWPDTRRWWGRARCGRGGAPANLRQGLFSTGLTGAYLGRSAARVTGLGTWTHTLQGIMYTRIHVLGYVYAVYTHTYIYKRNNDTSGNSKCLNWKKKKLTTFVKIKLAWRKSFPKLFVRQSHLFSHDLI